ncbi:MAG: hypothetical protein Q9161_002241 [Pseudevernia consocians]
MKQAQALVLAFSLAAVSHTAPANLGLNFDKRAGDLPTLKLPYATYQAASYNPDGDIYTFKNIRFAAPPVGELRWAKPAAPETETDIQDGSYGPICIQAPLKGPQLTGAGASSPLGEAANQFLAGIPVPYFANASEDCLFLDIYVPAAAVENPSVKLPVVSWFYGGAYIFGGKDSFGDILPLYDGTGVLQESAGNVIFVASNYRLGAYGWLAGTTMESDGLPNAGLYDQRAALQWIKSYISLVGGDPTQVSAWGESAGAGSILHQLVSFGGSQDPLFSKAVMQSPAFQLLLDRKGGLEQTFQNFTTLAGCAGQGLACLRSASAETLQSANTELNVQGPEGTFAVGPAADGNLIRQLAVLEYASGNFYKGIDSLILSHVSDEAFIFVPLDVTTDAQFSTFVSEVFPSYAQSAGVNAVIEARYPPVMNGSSNYTTEFDRTKALLADSSFQCNVRYLSDAYNGINYNLQYSVTPGFHATDLLPTFYDLNIDLTALGDNAPFPLIPSFGSFAQTYQSYLVSHARSGDPNTYAKMLNVPPAISWPKAASSSANELTGVLNAGDLGFGLISDNETTESVCGFWREVAAAVTNLGGQYYLKIEIVLENLLK